MPEGVALQGVDGGLTVEATAFLELLRAMASDDTPIGIRPAGSKADFVANNSTAWQVFSELVMNAEKAAARIYLGTDGTLGAQGGAPGVDISVLFGVASTKVQGDLECIERGLLTGLIEPWCAINFGDSSLAPARRYLLPDADEDALRASVADRRAAFFADIAAARDNGFDVTQEYVDAVAKEYGVTAPVLAPPPPAPVTNAHRRGGRPKRRSATAAVPAAAATLAAAVAGTPGSPSAAVLRLVPAAAPAPPPRCFAERHAAFLADLREYRERGLELDQARIEKLAELHDVPAPRLAGERT